MKHLYFFLFVCLTAPLLAQSPIDHSSPLWAFDYMRNAWATQQDDYTTLYRIEADSSFVSPDFRDYYGQALMTVYSFTGDYAGKERINKQFCHQNEALSQDEKLSQDIYAIDAKSFLLGKAQKESILIINEAHLYPQHRVFMSSLLPELAKLGYHHLFMEAISPDSTYIQPSFPSRDLGIYPCEPCMADLIRRAIRLGFQIHPYDGYLSANRDSASARNILARYRDFPQDKIIVYCGFAHNDEGAAGSVASYIQQFSGINPLTVDQTVYYEQETSPYYARLLRYYAIEKPAVLVNKQGKAIPLNHSGRDIFVISPLTHYINGYPDWLVCLPGSRWVANDFADYDAAVVFLQEEIDQTAHPIPFSCKQKPAESRQDSLLVPAGCPYLIKFYRYQGDKREIVEVRTQ